MSFSTSKRRAPEHLDNRIKSMASAMDNFAGAAEAVSYPCFSDRLMGT
jgi:hypothetical protein